MDQFARTKLLLGESSFASLQNIKVAIIGLGGVGSYAAEALARSGIKQMIIIDYDSVDITNLNRQLIATYEEIGNKKVEAMEKRIRMYRNDISITKIDTKLTEENVSTTLPSDIDYLIDACDTISVKKECIRYALKNNIKLISCMGTGNKLDPSKLEIMDIRKTSYDPIAKIIRKMVRDEQIHSKVWVVCSTEKSIVPHAKVIPSNSFVPSTAGLLMASYVINDVVKNENRK